MTTSARRKRKRRGYCTINVSNISILAYLCQQYFYFGLFMSAIFLLYHLCQQYFYLAYLCQQYFYWPIYVSNISTIPFMSAIFLFWPIYVSNISTGLFMSAIFLLAYLIFKIWSTIYVPTKISQEKAIVINPDSWCVHGGVMLGFCYWHMQWISMFVIWTRQAQEQKQEVDKNDFKEGDIMVLCGHNISINAIHRII